MQLTYLDLKIIPILKYTLGYSDDILKNISIYVKYIIRNLEIKGKKLIPSFETAEFQNLTARRDHNSYNSPFYFTDEN